MSRRVRACPCGPPRTPSAIPTRWPSPPGSECWQLPMRSTTRGPTPAREPSPWAARAWWRWWPRATRSPSSPTQGRRWWRRDSWRCAIAPACHWCSPGATASTRLTGACSCATRPTQASVAPSCSSTPWPTTPRPCIPMRHRPCRASRACCAIWGTGTSPSSRDRARTTDSTRPQIHCRAWGPSPCTAPPAPRGPPTRTARWPPGRRSARPRAPRPSWRSPTRSRWVP